MANFNYSSIFVVLALEISDTTEVETKQRQYFTRTFNSLKKW